jgi:hypothetical protein
VIDATPSASPSPPTTVKVGEPLTIVVHTTPNAHVTVRGAGVAVRLGGTTHGVLGAAKTISNSRGVARIKVAATKSGIITIAVGRHTVKRVGVLGAHHSGKSLTG